MGKFNLNDSGATILSKLNNTRITIGRNEGADYVCDGVDDDVQINQALAYANTLGGAEIVLRSGDYNISSTLYIYSNTSFVGEGYTSKIILNDSINLLMMRNYGSTCENILIEKIRFDGNDLNQTSQVGVLTLYGAKYSTIQNCWSENAKWSNITLDSASSYCEITGNFVTGGNGHGILLSNGCFRNDVHDNFIYDIGDDGGINFGSGSVYGYGIYLFKAGNDYNDIHNNQIYNVNGFGISLNAESGGLTGPENNNVIGNTIIGAGIKNTGVRSHHGIIMATASKNMVSKNRIYDSSAYGIYLLDSHYCSVLGNTVENTQQHGILLTDSDYNDISNNKVGNNGQKTVNTYYGITTANIAGTQTTRYNQINGNRCYDNQDVPTQRTGIRETNTTAAPNQESNYNTILNNYCHGNITGQIVSSGVDNKVRNNYGYITENSGTATVANGATTVVVTHGLSVTPTADDITVTPTNSMGNATKFFIGTFTSTQFTITVDDNPGATTATFAWKAIVL